MGASSTSSESNETAALIRRDALIMASYFDGMMHCFNLFTLPQSVNVASIRNIIDVVVKS